MPYWQLLTMPAVGGVIGWVTNVIAIRMLFRPHDPVKVPLLPITVQGLLPKYKAELAAAIGQAVEEELLPIEALIDQLGAKHTGDPAGDRRARGKSASDKSCPSFCLTASRGDRRPAPGLAGPGAASLLDKLTQQAKETGAGPASTSPNWFMSRSWNLM